MSILRDFEKRLEGAVEGFFARAFRSGLQPIELAKAVQRYASNYQQVGVEGVVVPNVYRFQLSQDDLDRFGGYITSLQRELASVVARTAEDRGWLLEGPVRIEFQPDEEIRVGTYELRGKIESGRPRSQPAPPPRPYAEDRPPPASHPAPAPPPPPAPRPEPDSAGVATTILPTSPRARPKLTRLGASGMPPVTLREGMVIGRLSECDVTVQDPSVSRRHARIVRDGDDWMIEDLGSTNGVRVNGENHSRVALQHGDRIELGTVRFAFSLEG